MPDWLSELYIAVLVFNVPVKRMFYYRRIGNGKWSVMINENDIPSIQHFINLLQTKDEADITLEEALNVP